MPAHAVLRDIRKNRKKALKEKIFLLGRELTAEEHRQILLIDPPFTLDNVSLMEIWREKRRQEQAKLNTSFFHIVNCWVEAKKDLDMQKNRRSCIQSLITSGILIKPDQKTTIGQFIQKNKLDLINKAIARDKDYSDHTQKTYQVAFRSFWKFIKKFISSPPRRTFKKIKPMKKGIRHLELCEAARLLDALERKAMRSSVAMRDLLIIRLIMYAGEGVEIKSILELKRSDINFDENIFTAKIRLTRKDIPVKCSMDFMKILRSYLGRRRESVFSDSKNRDDLNQDQINKRLSRMASELDIKNITPKSIQRSQNFILKSSGLI